ncbi:hypothetical protein LDI01_00910 [Lentilactobacillus diolivorans]|uniref:Uncharacterized protein n=1 Tax=Lentilactobacillus diolivorans TaxID=179838 RepID=A0ABQ0X8V6_9LACO|nr:hypothetical protein LDI01_00910 [Lentilactobacillus diolivorans]
MHCEYKSKDYHVILSGDFLFYHHDCYFFLWKNADLNLFQLIIDRLCE